MDIAGLLDSATALNVPVPAAAKAMREGRKPVARLPAREGKVLRGSGIGPVVSASEGGKLLDAITVDDEFADWVESDLVGAGELVERLNISRGTLDNWRKARKIIALRKGLRNFVYPLRQFERRRPLEGLDLVASFFASAEEAWEWLVAPNRMTDGKPPIEALRDGNVPAVRARRQAHSTTRESRHIQVSRAGDPRPHRRLAPHPADRHRATPADAGFGSSRFSSPSGTFRVLYAADNFPTAFAEAVVRDRFEGKARRFLYRPYLERLCVTAISSNRALALLDLRGAAAYELGIDTDANRAVWPGR